jgi:7-methyl-GTP pyrophosphatase
MGTGDFVAKLPLVLASTSVYRRELLSRLQIPFSIVSPKVNETHAHGESAEQTACRLAREKARAVGASFSAALIIGADQVAVRDGEPLGKPLTHENAVRQLKSMRGKTALFHTAVALHNSLTGHIQTRLVSSAVTFRELSDQQIENYLVKERPYDCAGSARIEGLGIALIEKIQVEDPNALIGLPLIALVGMLRNEGVDVL